MKYKQYNFCSPISFFRENSKTGELTKIEVTYDNLDLLYKAARSINNAIRHLLFYSPLGLAGEFEEKEPVVVNVEVETMGYDIHLHTVASVPVDYSKEQLAKLKEKIVKVFAGRLSEEFFEDDFDLMNKDLKGVRAAFWDESYTLDDLYMFMPETIIAGDFMIINSAEEDLL